jgi:TIR domain-containing protein
MRDLVFISYAHQDEVYFDKLMIHLAPLTRDQTILDWSDKKIIPGALWRDAIKAALDRTQTAILLVSPHFLHSRFIAEHELPPLLDAAEKKKTTTIWVPVSYSLYDQTKIKDYQFVSDPAQPLKSLSEADQDRVLVNICRAVKASTWSLTIKLDNLPNPVAHKTTISGKAIFQGKKDAKESLTEWMANNNIRLVPYVFSTDGTWWAQQPLKPDQNGRFSGDIWVGDSSSAGRPFKIVVCAASQIKWGGAPQLPEVRRESNICEVTRS